MHYRLKKKDIKEYIVLGENHFFLLQYVIFNKEYLDFIVQEVVGKMTHQLDYPGNVVMFL